MAASQSKTKLLGYLPNDVPPIGQLILLGFQHVLTMFPATVLVALLVGFHVSTVLFASGVATIVALILARWRIGKFIPLYYGSSFSYIAATLAITKASYGVPAPDELIRVAQGGIIVTGLVNIIVGAIIRFAGGKKTIDKILPPVVTGSVAAVIGFALGKSALDMASGLCCTPDAHLRWWFVAIITLLATIMFSVYLQGKGFIGMIPILLGAIVGYIVAIPLGLVDFSAITSAKIIQAPHITFPTFGHEMTATAIISIAVMAIATIPESTAHLYQISLYVDELAARMKRKAYGLSEYIGFNLILDGLGDMINGLFGGVAGTNYGENNSLMVITRNYSGPALIAGGVIAILLSFSGTLAGIVQSVPTAVSGGLAIYLFGVIGMQGVALMMAEKVNLFDPRQLAVGAVILIIGVGGHIGYPDGFLPIRLLPGVFPYGWPAIATGAVAGILLNAIFLIFKPPQVSAE
ncbi:MAG: xanthine permease [Anaerolineae bacterium]|nr:xanthine permease [Anaerolineae bacterium]